MDLKNFYSKIEEMVKVEEVDCDHSKDMHAMAHCVVCKQRFGFIQHLFAPVVVDEERCVHPFLWGLYQAIFHASGSPIMVKLGIEDGGLLTKTVRELFKSIAIVLQESRDDVTVFDTLQQLLTKAYLIMHYKQDLAESLQVFDRVSTDGYGVYMLPDTLLPLTCLVEKSAEDGVWYLDGVVKKGFVTTDLSYDINRDVFYKGYWYHYRKVHESEQFIQFVLVRVYEVLVAPPEEEVQDIVDADVEMSEHRMVFTLDKDVTAAGWDIFYEEDIFEGVPLAERTSDRWKFCLSMLHDQLERDTVIVMNTVYDDMVYISFGKFDLNNVFHDGSLLIGCSNTGFCHRIILPANEDRYIGITGELLLTKYGDRRVNFKYRKLFGVAYLHFEDGCDSLVQDVIYANMVMEILP